MDVTVASAPNARTCTIEDVKRLLQLDEESRTIGDGKLIRMTDEAPRRYSIIDAIVALTGKNAKDVPTYFLRMRCEFREVILVTPKISGHFF